MAKKRFPPAEYHFAYENPPLSGNTINGLGITEPVRARSVFHGSGARKLEWRLLEQFFALTMPFRVYCQNLLNRWVLRKADGPVAPFKQPIYSPAQVSGHIKDIAMHAGAGKVGIAQVTQQALYKHYETDLPNAVVVVMPMNHEIMQTVPSVPSAVETMRVYLAISKTAIRIAEHIRGLGWTARAYCEGADILHIPLAIDAGLGELGKHGSLINKEFGSNFRIASVLTDLPLEADAPIDIGVDDLCLGCQRCTVDCPADAILPKKQMVRGVEKWYVDFDRCVPYFVKTMGCGICIEVCPWTKPGRGESLSQKLLSKRAKPAYPQA